MRPDKGSGAVLLNRRDYEKSVKNLIKDKTKFKKPSEDVNIKRESKLQHFLRTLKNNKCLDDVEYEKIFPSGSSAAKNYGSPKMHKPFDPNCLPNFRPIVSSIGTYNYNLSKYLGELISPNLPNEFCTKDTFTFVEGLKEVSINDKFLVSFDVNSLFKNIPFKETIKLAVDLIKTSYPNLKKSSDNLTKGAYMNYVGRGAGGFYKFFKKFFIAQETIDLHISWPSNFFRKYFMAPPISFSFLYKANL